MTTLSQSLSTRRDEFESHFLLAKALEDRMILDELPDLGAVSLSSRHINTIKSGLLVHLYNIEEAMLSQALQFLGTAIGSSEPSRWTEHSLREWLRESIVSRIGEANEDGRLETVFASSTQLLSAGALGPQKLKKPSGTWDDKAIATFLRRMRIACEMPPEMWRRIAASPTYADRTPLQFLALRRNAIAHGRRSFEAGASDMGLSEVRVLADIVLDYLGYVTVAVENHVSANAHLLPAA